jgi:hypothetical protein
MTEEKKEGWLNYLALTTVILAVCATLASFKGGGYSTRSILSQTQASDQWAFYQAKSIKGNLYEVEKDKLELEMKALGPGAPEALTREYVAHIDACATKARKYSEEKAQIEKDARRLEDIRNDASRHSQGFGVAVIYLQVAILLSSVAALMKKRPLWLLGVAVGTVGVVHFANGFMLFFR